MDIDVEKLRQMTKEVMEGKNKVVDKTAQELADTIIPKILKNAEKAAKAGRFNTEISIGHMRKEGDARNPDDFDEAAFYREAMTCAAKKVMNYCQEQNLDVSGPKTSDDGQLFIEISWEEST